MLYKMTARKVIAVPFRVMSKKGQELCVSLLIFICNFSFAIKNCQAVSVNLVF